MKRLHVVLAILTLNVLLMVAPVRAQVPAVDADYPTLDALETTTLPAANVVALAQQLRGVGEVPPPPVSAPVRQVGERQSFWAINSSENKEFEIPATLRALGQHIYLWVQEDVAVNVADLQKLADVFDTEIYPNVRKLWGEEASPGVDGDPRLYGLFAHGLGPGVAAYFFSRHTYPKAVFPTSNQHEMFFFNLDAINPNDIASRAVQSTVAHEFQHMIRANLHVNEDIWINEGFSTFTQLYLYGDLNSAYSFLFQPGTQLNTWAEENTGRAPHYGAAMLFVDYFFERYGLSALQTLSADHERRAMDAIDYTLKQMGKPGVNELFADWVLANFLLNPQLEDGRYGYQRLPPGTPSALPRATINTYPLALEGQVNQYASDYYVLTNVQGVKTLSITLQSPTTVNLIPTNPTSGRWMWYSNRGDQSDTTLTRAFDLTGVQTATLNYSAWYYTEKFWDYGYVMVSADDGKTWKALSTAHTTTENPQSTAYGPGYTGQSDGWVQESASLNDYAGKKIQIRFEVITDDAVNQPGMAVDDVSIPEIGYSSDFESGDGGWAAKGWLRIDNVLPQQVWVQAVQQIGEHIKPARWLGPAGTAWTLPLDANVNQVVLVISPFAPVTTVPMSYTLKVTAEP